MEKAKDYFINFVLFLIYFVIVFLLLYSTILRVVLIGSFFLLFYVSWSVFSLSTFLKKLSVTCTVQPVVYRKKVYRLFFL